MWTLRADHWTIEEGIRCARCNAAFVAGDVVELHKARRVARYTVASNRLRHTECPEAKPMIASEDEELFDWLQRAAMRGGSFVRSIADAGRYADHENYALLRPVLLALREKYPEYSQGNELIPKRRE